jgi:hypothetical protein
MTAKTPCNDLPFDAINRKSHETKPDRLEVAIGHWFLSCEPWKDLSVSLSVTSEVIPMQAVNFHVFLGADS